MKKTDYFFWLILGLIAIFYLVKGNTMHDERYQMVKESIQVEAN